MAITWRKKIGDQGEKIAEKFLKKQGMKFLTRQFKTSTGEIDLIMQDRSEIVFVEVKYRKNEDYGNGLYSITKSKQRKLIKTAAIYLKSKRIKDIPYRFDIISIIGDKIEYIENAIWGDYL